jgi:malate synthase
LRSKPRQPIVDFSWAAESEWLVLEVQGSKPPHSEKILTTDALGFVEKLVAHFGPRRLELLERRRQVQARLDSGWDPDFRPDTEEIRRGSWRVGSIPKDLQDRRVEITGPVDRKMVINALNCGANVFMADFEDSHAPSWSATLEGQWNLFEAVRRSLAFTSPDGKPYKLNDKIATLFVRPRGWHLNEKHVLWKGKPVSASLVDFGLFFFHNAREQVKRGTGPYFYLPKLEAYEEAKLWDDVFVFSQESLGLPRGTIKTTVLIETILGAFEMEEILYALKDHCVGLNCGRWDYIFSFIKKFRNRPDRVLPDRATVTMTQPFLKAYAEKVIQVCHRRGAHAMGGMAAQIPIKEDAAANQAALDKVRADKEREALAGHDGTWVAHPGLVAIAREQFDKVLAGRPNQVDKKREDVRVSAADLLRVPEGKITEAGLRVNVSVGLQYLEAWLRGNGCVPLYHLMEDAATAEISRAQVWQWIRHPKGVLEDGRRVTVALFRECLRSEMDRLKEKKLPKLELAGRLFDEITTSDVFAEFLTLPAGEYLD